MFVNVTAGLPDVAAHTFSVIILRTVQFLTVLVLVVFVVVVHFFSLVLVLSPRRFQFGLQAKRVAVRLRWRSAVSMGS